MPRILGRRHLSRLREISAILARHGLGWVLLQLGLGDLIPFHKGWLGHARREAPYTQPEHFRLAMEDLGVVFIKMGQILSTRPDLVPPEYITEFARLQDAAPPVSYADIAPVIERELGGPPGALFAELDPVPRASASIGQVHRARLADGSPVIVKVQRPGIEAAVELDLGVLADLARLASRHTWLGEYYDLQGWMEEFSFTLRNELDYTREARNADVFRRNFASDPTVYIPRVFWELTTRGVLTMEEIRGIKVSDVAALESAGYDRRLIAKNSVRILLTEVFEHGFFHADPHPGNFFILPGEVIGPVDFGMVGQLDEALQDALLRLALALMLEDADRLVDELLGLGVAPGRVLRAPLKRDLAHWISSYTGRSIGEWAAGRAMNEMMAVAFRHHLQLPTDLVLLTKVVGMSEGLGVALDPKFKLLEFAQPYLRRFQLRRLSPGRIGRKLGPGLLDLVELGLVLPQRFRRLLAELERGDLTITAHHEGLEELSTQLHRASNRLAMSILTAALVVGLGVLMAIYRPPGWSTWGGWFFTASFLVATGMGLWLLGSIWRSR